ncbi:MAG: hypothetical protein WCK47_03810 [bacterium]|nr:hypothetical protein [Candidatus Sumerlaeota bacterium]
MILKFFFVTPWISLISNELEQWGIVTLAFAIILGVLNLMKINLKTVMERKRDWGYKLLLLASMFFMMGAGGLQWYHDVMAGRTAEACEKAFAAASAPNAPAAAQQDAAALKSQKDAARLAADKNAFSFSFYNIYYPLAATIYSLLAFYVASAAFRAFRAKNLHATLLLIAAIIVMIGRVPIGGYIWKGFPWLQDWLMIWPNTAGQRAIQMGAAIGMIAMGLRVIFGIERPYLKG